MNPQEIINWLRTGIQGPSKPNREIAADCIEQLRGSLVVEQARIAELERLIEHMSHKAELYDEARALVGTLGHMNVTNAVSSLQSRIAELEAQAAIVRRAVDVLKGMEWPVSRLTGEKYCPNCGQYASHDSTCELAAILRDAEQAGVES